MRNKKNIRWIACIIIIIGAAVVILPWKTKVNKDIESVLWKIGDDGYSKNITVTVKGTYNNYLLRNDTFKGKISVEGYDFTYDSEMGELEFSDGIADISYFNINNDGVPKINSLGFLICEPDFSEFLIGVRCPVGEESNGWNSDDGINICGYAEERSEAVKIANKLALNSEWLSQAPEDFR